MPQAWQDKLVSFTQSATGSVLDPFLFFICRLTLGQMFQLYLISFHFYPDDPQIHIVVHHKNEQLHISFPCENQLSPNFQLRQNSSHFSSLSIKLSLTGSVIVCVIRPKSLLLHCCIFPLAQYLNVAITFISGLMEFALGGKYKRIANDVDHKHYTCMI